jgi:general secretion pathway protein B
MSFILDALKKSEAERQRKSTPGFADIPDARKSSGAPRWLWALAGLLAINLTVLVVILMRPASSPEPDASTPLSLETADGAPQPAFSELVAAAKENQRNAEDVEPASPVAAMTGPSDEPPPEPEPVATDVGSLSTFNQLRASGTLQLPDLHLDLHVYGDRPADRFVVINMSRYKEGATLAEGPRVKEILPAGIVLEHGGTAFFLPRE